MVEISGSFLAPIHDYTDLPFRILCRGYGAGHTCIPLINANGIVSNPDLVRSIRIPSLDSDAGLQIVGNDPKIIAQAILILDETLPRIGWFDLNCGCPSAKTMGCGGGSALLSDPEKMGSIVQAMKESTDRKISVKIRIGPSVDSDTALSRMLEKAGADFLIVHGRTIRQGYSGSADWERIRSIKDSINIPVVGNGDVSSDKSGRALIDDGFCDAYMSARSAMSNPMMFCDREPGDGRARLMLLEEYKELCFEHDQTNLADRIKDKAIHFMRGIDGAASIRAGMMTISDTEELMEFIASRVA